MIRTLFLVYSAIAYLVGLASLAYLFGFLIDFGVPKGINDGVRDGVWLSVVTDVCLVLGFGLHHSLTARTSFKRWWTRWVPAPVERSTYILMTAVLTFIVVYLWKPVPITLWSIDSGFWAALVLIAYLGTWIMMLASTFQFGHFGFMGIRPAWDHFLGRQARPGSFTARYLYAIVRHPISLGWMVMPWLTPHMTVGQLVWAASVTVYVIVATGFEEGDLTRQIGDEYRTYRKEVPRFVPTVKRQ